MKLVLDTIMRARVDPGLSSHSAGDLVINQAVGCHYFLPASVYLPSCRASTFGLGQKRRRFAGISGRRSCMSVHVVNEEDYC